MSVHLIAIIVLVALFAIGTVMKVHMGVLGFVAAFFVGTIVFGQSTDDILTEFPGDLFVILVGVTLLFAIAKNNGTIDLLVQGAVRAVGGRAAAIPWVMFLVTALLTALGSVVPAAIAIIAPIGLGFARRYRINPLMMSLLIVNGSNAGGFSPISIYGGIINGVLNRSHLASNSGLLFGIAFAFNLVLSIIVYLAFGGRELLGRDTRSESGAAGDARSESGAADLGGGTAVAGAGVMTRQSAAPGTGSGPSATATVPSSGVGSVLAVEPGGAGLGLGLNRDQALTIAGIIGLIVAAVGFSLDVGLVALTVAAILTLLEPGASRNAVGDVAWNAVLLICGIVIYVDLLKDQGTITWLGNQVAGVGTPLLAALIVCYIGGVVSAFASTTGILGALIPLAVPFISAGNISAVALIIALAISSSVVDSSPFSTSGALCVANTDERLRDTNFRRLMTWGFSMIVIAPAVAWVILVVPGW